MGAKQVILYARASTDEQAYSIGGQLRELREYAEREGFKVVTEIEDQGEKRHTLERPGIEQLREVCSAGNIDEVWAWAWDRYGEFPRPEVLVLELEDFGTVLRSLDDGGAGEDSYEMRAIKSIFSRREQRSRVKRSNRGRADKSLRGEVFGGFRARYGFRFVKGQNQRGAEVNVGYEADEEKIVHVRRIFEMVAAGSSLKAVRREFESEGVPNPSGGPRWSTTTIKNAIQDDIYKPHSYEEIEGLIPPGVAAKLDRERVYGIHWSGRKRSKFKNHRSKQRTVYETPPEEWIAVPVDLKESGLCRATVEAARERIKDNKPTSSVGDRFWELSGILKCAECGRNMISYRRARRPEGTGYRHYYRCRPASRIDLEACSNRKSHPAERLEEQANELLTRILSDKETFARRIEELYDEDIDRLRLISGSIGGGSERLAGKMEKLLARRRAYQEQQADGLMTRDELRERLDDLEEQTEAIRTRLEDSRNASEKIAALEREKSELLAVIEGAGWISYTQKSPEARRANYDSYRMRFTVDKDGNLKASGERQVREKSLQPEHISSSAGRPVRARRCSPGGFREYCRRSPWKKASR